jgi:hypothetical protein
MANTRGLTISWRSKEVLEISRFKNKIQARVFLCQSQGHDLSLRPFSPEGNFVIERHNIVSSKLLSFELPHSRMPRKATL